MKDKKQVWQMLFGVIGLSAFFILVSQGGIWQGALGYAYGYSYGYNYGSGNNNNDNTNNQVNNDDNNVNSEESNNFPIAQGQNSATEDSSNEENSFEEDNKHGSLYAQYKKYRKNYKNDNYKSHYYKIKYLKKSDDPNERALYLYMKQIYNQYEKYSQSELESFNLDEGTLDMFNDYKKYKKYKKYKYLKNKVN